MKMALFHKSVHVSDANWNTPETDHPIEVRIHIEDPAAPMVVTFGVYSLNFQMQLKPKDVATIRDLFNQAIYAVELATAGELEVVEEVGF
jgi:hypothetical protein